jgi:hypothetical protein
MPTPKSIPLKEAFSKYSEETQFSHSKCVSTFHRFLENRAIIGFVVFNNDYFQIPANFWISKKIELRRMLDLPFPAELKFEDISTFIAEDIKILAQSTLEKNSLLPTLASLGIVAEKMGNPGQKDGDDKHLIRQLFDFAGSLISLSGAEGEILVETSGLKGSIKRARKTKGGRPSSPAPDGMYEAVIARIIEEGPRPGKETIKNIMKRFFVKSEGAERDIYKPNTKVTLEYGESYFNERAEAIVNILHGGVKEPVETARAESLQPLSRP